jgi:hypothetical protein
MADPYSLIRMVFCKVFCPCPPPKPVASVKLQIGNLSFKCKGDFSMAFPIDTPVVVATVEAFVDSRGNPATVDGVPTWETDRPDVVDLEPAADGMSCQLKPRADFMGLAAPVITQRADADMGAGVVEVVTVGILDLTAGQAVSGTMTFAVPAP